MNYYEVLGVSKDADIKEIKKSYRRLATKYHPDKNMGDKASEEKIKEINEAYETLSNVEKRKEYDLKLSNPFSERFKYSRRNDESSHDEEGFSFTEDFSDIFSDIFSTFTNFRSGSSASPEFEFSNAFKRDSDNSFEDFVKNTQRKKTEENKPAIHVDVFLTPKESITGVIKEIMIPELVKKLNIKFPKDAVPGKSLKIKKDSRTIYFHIKWKAKKWKFNDDSVEMNLKFDKVEEKVLIKTPFGKEYHVHLPKDIEIGDKVRLSGLGWDSEDKSKKMDLYVNIIK